MKHFIIGTAGHIDHGKTALIKALTGQDTDRLAEEKKRGITIELGFAGFQLPGGKQAGIVDVPGHEKFINNMVMGVSGMDMVMLVIAADEGIMPQTVEHMDILKLLGVKKSIVVLNKIDLVDAEWLDMVEDEIKCQLEDTIFVDSPIVKVSAVTGQGLKELIGEIERMAQEEIEVRDVHTIPRLPIDRVFTLSGFGTIVTGTILTGKIQEEDILNIYPIEKECRVRSVQVHGENTKICYAGQRAAINLANVKKEDIYRGCVLAPVDSMKKTNLLDVKLHMLKTSKRTLKNNSRLHLFVGTDEVLCRAVLLDRDELNPGESGYVQLKLEKELAVQRKDKFIVRFYSPLETIGGGEIIDANPVKKKRFKEEVIQELQQKEKGTLGEIIELHLKDCKNDMMTVSELAKITANSREEVQKEIEQLEKRKTVFIIPAKKDNYVCHVNSFYKMSDAISEKLNEYTEKYPYRYGMKKSEIQASCLSGMKQNIFDKFIEKLEEENIIKRNHEILSMADHKIQKDQRFIKISEKYIDILTEKEYNFIRVSEIENINISDEILADILHALEEEQVIVKISEDIYTMKSYIDQAKNKIQEHFIENPIITIIQVKEMFHTSRKNAKLIVEYMDGIKVTRKSGAETERTAY